MHVWAWWQEFDCACASFQGNYLKKGGARVAFFPAAPLIWSDP